MTVTVLAAEPLGELHVKVKEVVAARVAVASEPVETRGPLQPPLAAHELALVDDQIRVAVLPATMLPGVTSRETTGGPAAAGIDQLKLA